ncbi:MAG TPA: D-lyxose/D-mannose family sugar isomerase [Bacteroidetes bacterium]|nr:MAG: D-lyxose/D-mannose family sugar isomerase [Ignavibacteria bacterium GWA2_54_16]HCA79303.1 D-lyxose/D-mannose family sugar isomerase [Bacteroidota bacterium]
MKREEVEQVRQEAVAILQRANIVLSEPERSSMEVADFGLNDIRNLGLEIVVYENNDRYCAKELVLFPRQMCPQHRHPRVSATNPGKRETFRCRWGEVYLYVEGEATADPRAVVPARYRPYVSVWREIILRPGQQHTLEAGTLHWFQAGDQGAIVSEFSSTSMDETDVFTDPNIKRAPVIS